MAATVSSVFRVCAHVCYPSFSRFTGCDSTFLGALTPCFVFRGKCWPFAFSVFCICFNAWSFTLPFLVTVLAAQQKLNLSSVLCVSLSPAFF
jgi:hypothetical protein